MSATTTQQKYEVLHCYPLQRAIVYNSPKRSIVTTLKIATAVAKCKGENIAEGFPIIRAAPFENAITPEQHEKLTPIGAVVPPEWEVVARTADKASGCYMIGRSRITVADMREAEAIAVFVRQFVYSLRKGMQVQVVPYLAIRVFESENATEINQVV